MDNLLMSSIRNNGIIRGRLQKNLYLFLIIFIMKTIDSISRSVIIKLSQRKEDPMSENTENITSDSQASKEFVRQRRFYEKYGYEYSTVGEGFHFEGDFKGVEGKSQNIKIHGKFSGNIYVSGVVFIEENASFEGNIEANCIIASGSCRGDLNAFEKIELRSTADITGAVVCPSIAVAEGCQINGEISSGVGKLNRTDFLEKRRK